MCLCICFSLPIKSEVDILQSILSYENAHFMTFKYFNNISFIQKKKNEKNLTNLKFSTFPTVFFFSIVFLPYIKSSFADMLYMHKVSAQRKSHFISFFFLSMIYDYSAFTFKVITLESGPVILARF